jgi:hypothetical protein
MTRSILRRPALALALPSFLLVLFACGPSGTYGGGDDFMGSSSGTGEQCSAAEDCSTVWYCYCESGPPVNARRCYNGGCQHAEGICEDSCADFGTTWTGTWGSSDDVSTEAGAADGSDTGLNGTSDEAQTCDGFYNSSPCGSCGERDCCTEGGRCRDNRDCVEITACVSSCQAQGAGEWYCESECSAVFPFGAATYDDWASCVRNECEAECYG